MAINFLQTGETLNDLFLGGVGSCAIYAEVGKDSGKLYGIRVIDVKGDQNYELSFSDIDRISSTIKTIKTARTAIWPVDEEWLFKNKEALKSVQTGLTQEPKIPYKEYIAEKAKKGELQDIVKITDPLEILPKEKKHGRKSRSKKGTHK